MIAQPARTREDAEIRRLIADWRQALCVQDLDRLMSHYASDVVIYDVKPPFQTHGAEAWRRTWQECLPYFPASFQTEIRDLRIFGNGDVAVAHWVWRFTGLPKGHPAMQTWQRATVGYERREGRWKIVHEHASLPFRPETSLAAFTLDP